MHKIMDPHNNNEGIALQQGLAQLEPESSKRLASFCRREAVRTGRLYIWMPKADKNFDETS